MTKSATRMLNRREFGRLAAAFGVGSTGMLSAAIVPSTVSAAPSRAFSDPAFEKELAADQKPAQVRHKISSFRTHSWQEYFENLRNGAILVDTKKRALHFWTEDRLVYKIYPTSVPLTPELTRLGRTRVVRKQIGPEWRPTPKMLQRDPTLPKYVGPGPENPLGTHALYLSWQYYRIHGTNDTRKIGRQSSNGCIGLFNNHIAELFDMAKVGTQVLLI